MPLDLVLSYPRLFLLQYGGHLPGARGHIPCYGMLSAYHLWSNLHGRERPQPMLVHEVTILLLQKSRYLGGYIKLLLKIS